MSKYASEDDVYEIEEESTLKIDAGADLHIQAKGIRHEPSHILRVEEVVRVEWGGVKGCPKRADKEIASALTRWANSKKKFYSDLKYLSHSYHDSEGKCWKKKSRWTNVRTCGCSIGVRFYIDFQRP